MKRLTLAAALSVALVAAGCASNGNGMSTRNKGTAAGAVIGAGLGAGIAALAGGDTEDTLIAAGAGAAVGGVAGRQIGKHIEKQRAEMQAILDDQDQLRTQLGQTNAMLTVALSGDILFEFGKHEVLPGARDKIVKIANNLRSYPYQRILVLGHTDDIGSEQNNLGLSLLRAKAVYDILVANGIDQSRITYDGAGESRPLVPNTSEENRAKNRRVEINVVS